MEPEPEPEPEVSKSSAPATAQEPEPEAPGPAAPAPEPEPEQEPEQEPEPEPESEDEPEPEPEPEPETDEHEPEPQARDFECRDTPSGETGFAALIIDMSAAEDEDSLLYQYQNAALDWDVGCMKGQFEALTALARDLVSKEATVVDLKLRTGQGGEDLVKAAFRTIKGKGFEALVVFVFQVNVVRSALAQVTARQSCLFTPALQWQPRGTRRISLGCPRETQASIDVLSSMQVLSEDEARRMMPSEIVPRPLADRGTPQPPPLQSWLITPWVTPWVTPGLPLQPGVNRRL